MCFCKYREFEWKFGVERCSTGLGPARTILMFCFADRRQILLISTFLPILLLLLPGHVSGVKGLDVC